MRGFSLWMLVLLGCGDAEKPSSGDTAGSFDATAPDADGSADGSVDDGTTDDGTTDDGSDSSGGDTASADGGEDTSGVDTGTSSVDTGDTSAPADTGEAEDSGESVVPFSDCITLDGEDGFSDCELNCLGADFYATWIGDGTCDDGDRGVYFNCEELTWDGGDCEEVSDVDLDESADSDDSSDVDGAADSDGAVDTGVSADADGAADGAADLDGAADADASADVDGAADADGLGSEDGVCVLELDWLSGCFSMDEPTCLSYDGIFLPGEDCPDDEDPFDDGSSDEDPPDTGIMDDGPMDDGPMDDGSVDDDPADDDPMDDDPMDDDPMDDGPADDGGTDPIACDTVDLGSELGVVAFGSTDDSEDDWNGACGISGGQDEGHMWTAPWTGVFEFTTDGSDFDTVLRLVDTDCETELTCDDSSGEGARSTLERTLTVGETVVVVVDGFWSGSSGDYFLTIEDVDSGGDGPIDDGFDDDGPTDDGFDADGTSDDGFDDGTTDDGTVDDGTVDDGAADDDDESDPDPIIEVYESATCEDAGDEFTVVGDRIAAHYNEGGNWNNSGSLGFEIGTGDGTYYEACFPGSPWQVITMEWDEAGSTQNYTGNYDGRSWDWTTTCGGTVGDGDSITGAIHEWTMGSLKVTKTEIWAVDGQVSRVWFDLTNTGSSTLTDLDLMFGVDPDQDEPPHGTFSTLNDVNNTGDYAGLAEGALVSSEGPTSGRTLVFGRCDADNERVGHTASWVEDDDFTPIDYDGESGDLTMYWGRQDMSLAPGESASAGFLVSVGETISEAVDAYADTREALCVDNYLPGESGDDGSGDDGADIDGPGDDFDDGSFDFDGFDSDVGDFDDPLDFDFGSDFDGPSDIDIDFDGSFDIGGDFDGPPDDGPSDGGPMLDCSSDSDCSISDCPPGSVECVCADFGMGGLCVPGCDTSSDCPSELPTCEPAFGVCGP